MGDILHGIKTRHILFLQEVSGMALAFRKNADQHIGAGDFLAARRLDMHDGALNDALE